MCRASQAAIVVIIVCALTGRTAGAQERITIAADVLLYGDNTEFRNPFREGKTLFGAAPKVFAIFDLNDRAALELGIFANQRFGSETASELTRPVIALRLHSRSQAFTFGTLQTLGRRSVGEGGVVHRSFSEGGPHNLLPPLQVETLAFERPYEAGFQWTAATERVQHDAWLSWQKLNTPEQREQFDAGTNTRVRLSRALSLPLQFHVVHRGGQQFASGPVADSLAGAAGGTLHWARGTTSGELEFVGLASRYVPDRERPERSRTGRAFIGRASTARAGWRGHILFWRGKDFVKDEGDPNYQSIRRNGTYYGNTRDYAEAGIARMFAPAREVKLELSARLHRVEKDYGYSYRVIGITSMRWIVKGTR